MAAPEVRPSPSFTTAKLTSGTIEDMIDIYEDRVRGFLLEHARALVPRPNSELAVLQLVIGYFESHATYLRGQDSKGRSPEFFKAGFLDVFGVGAKIESPDMPIPPGFLEELAEMLYEDARCGLSHDAMTRRRIMLSHHAKAPIGASVNMATQKIAATIVNPRKWLDEVEAHLKEYVTRLRDPKNVDLRRKFETLFKLKNPPGAVINFPPVPGGFFE